jgi:hypothetical protein
VKYKSLRFFIAINSLIGWAVIVIGCLFSLLGAFVALADRSSVFGFLGFLIVGGSLSAIAGMFIFALGDLFQIFLDIEENTRATANVSKEDASNKARINVQTSLSREESSRRTVTYLCLNCNRFQNSDVIECENCGAANPHHPSNKSKPETSKADIATDNVSPSAKCSRCGVGMNQMDKLCSSCGEPRT